MNWLLRAAAFYDIFRPLWCLCQDRYPAPVNQGISRQDLALSSFHAIAKQTIGGLAQGLDIQKPVVFEGGPLTFNPTLVNVFAKTSWPHPMRKHCVQPILRL